MKRSPDGRVGLGWARALAYGGLLACVVGCVACAALRLAWPSALALVGASIVATLIVRAERT